MKANEAPEKLYISSIKKRDTEKCYSATIVKYCDDDIEYTRTDAFIEKALKWYCLDCECNNNCKDTKCFFYREYERYLKGYENALPPKFECTILNHDGSISDNWRYRHFIIKLRDVFIEKADKFISTFFHPNDTELIKCALEQFHKHMKGEGV